MSPVVCDPAKRRTHRNSVLMELRQMQEVAFNRVINPETEDKDVAQLLRAYVIAEQQRNVLRMRPAPKPIDVSDRQASRQRRPRALNRPIPMPQPPAQ